LPIANRVAVDEEAAFVAAAETRRAAAGKDGCGRHTMVDGLILSRR